MLLYHPPLLFDVRVVHTLQEGAITGNAIVNRLSPHQEVCFKLNILIPIREHPRENEKGITMW